MTHHQSTGRYLADLTWQEAEHWITADRLLVLPLGAACKEHGPHLRLDNDRVMAEHYAEQLRQVLPVLVCPTLGFHYYPAFIDYPGSATLSLESAVATTVEICESFMRAGARRFYCLNTGYSTMQPLGVAAEQLAEQGVLFRYTDLAALVRPLAERIAEQEGGTHADEVETSVMLHIAPDRVDMTRAVCDYHPGRGLSRTPVAGKAWSASGVYGDATLASESKGARYVEAVLAGVLRECEDLMHAPCQ